jgi:hypothetical protein
MFSGVTTCAVESMAGAAEAIGGGKGLGKSVKTNYRR